jgi:outer membrane protein assembly factor BamB
VQSAHGYVYSSPAVWKKRIYIGSYDKRLYVLDAATGEVIWKFKSNGPISGSPTIVNGVVYFSTLERKTYALDARTGRELWNYRDGQYTPVVTDGERLYLVGHARVYGMEGLAEVKARAKREREKRAPARIRRQGSKTRAQS